MATSGIIWNRSIATELMSMTASAPMTLLTPSFRKQMMKIGMFIRMIITPTGRPLSLLMICAMPVTPPETMSFG